MPFCRARLSAKRLIAGVGGYKRTDKEGRAITLHGMRATLATWGQDQGFAPKVIDMALAHKEPDRVTEAYLRSELLPPRRKLLDAWGAFATSKG